VRARCWVMGAGAFFHCAAADVAQPLAAAPIPQMSTPSCCVEAPGLRRHERLAAAASGQSNRQPPSRRVQGRASAAPGHRPKRIVTCPGRLKVLIRARPGSIPSTERQPARLAEGLRRCRLPLPQPGQAAASCGFGRVRAFSFPRPSAGGGSLARDFAGQANHGREAAVGAIASAVTSIPPSTSKRLGARLILSRQRATGSRSSQDVWKVEVWGMISSTSSTAAKFLANGESAQPPSRQLEQNQFNGRR